MGTMAPPPPHWTSYDDVLLKNAVEAGASLESLAKGAVHFTLRYNVQELQDRWKSLLYDSTVSEQAAACMIEVERSAGATQSKNSKLESVKELISSSGKRRAESIRKCYYSRRKRICNEPFEMMGMNILTGPGNPNPGHVNEFSSADYGIINPAANNLHEFGPDSAAAESIGNAIMSSFTNVQNHAPEPQLGRENVSHSFLFSYRGNISPVGDCSQIPVLDQSRQLPPYNTFGTDGIENKGNACLEFGGSHVEAPRSCDSISTEEYLTELSNTLFDFSNEDELLLIDTDGKEPIDKSYLDNFSSLLLESPHRSDADAIIVAPDGHFVQKSGSLSGAADNVAVQNGHQRKISEPQIAACLSSAEKVGPEYRNGVICCVLSTKHPDIPDNDDVFLPFRCPSPCSSSRVHWRLHDPDCLVSSSPSDFSTIRNTNVGPSRAQNNHKNGTPSSCMMGSSQLSDASRVFDQGLKFELPRSNVHHAAPRNIRNRELPNLNMDIERGKGVDYKPCCPSAGKNSHGFDAGSSMSVLDAEQEIPRDGLSKSGSAHQKENIGDPDKPLGSDHEDLWSEDDFDIPDFSDVEQMILDMDLCPDEHDIYTNPEVQRYQNEETKKTIIRLEQAANACARRAVAVRGAFAVLYGRYSRYYIKKPEVLVGRAADDMKVDIDLGRERNGGKVSRRQANVKVDGSGMFHLKNLGKSPIYVRGKEVASGHSINLTSGCLIQIRRLSYVFDANEARLKQYLNSMASSSDHKPLQKN